MMHHAIHISARKCGRCMHCTASCKCGRLSSERRRQLVYPWLVVLLVVRPPLPPCPGNRPGVRHSHCTRRKDLDGVGRRSGAKMIGERNAGARRERPTKYGFSCRHAGDRCTSWRGWKRAPPPTPPRRELSAAGGDHRLVPRGKGRRFAVCVDEVEGGGRAPRGLGVCCVW